MFGYVVINQGEMKFKDYDIYHSYYCGLCRSLKEAGGKRCQLTLSYDMTFFVMLLTALYEVEPTVRQERCLAHPKKKHLERRNEISDYCGDMNIVLTYYKCVDDWQDEKKPDRYLFGALLKKKVEKIQQKYPEKCKVIREGLEEINRQEKEKSCNADQMATLFGEIMGEILAWREDEWKTYLYRVGFYLGKFIYLMDAYEDAPEDEKKGTYNPFFLDFPEESWHPKYGKSDFDEKCEQMLRMMMAECAKAYDMLPILWYEDILNNVIYSGVWTRFELVKKQRGEKQEDENERSL